MPPKGFRHSEETKRKISLATKGKPNCTAFKRRHLPFNKGQEMPESVRQKMSYAKIGIGLTAEERKQRHDWQKNERNRIVQQLKKDGRSHSQKDWDKLKEQYGNRCLSCGRGDPEVILEKDHIVPLSKGGTDEIKNIQPLCPKCNGLKGTQIIPY